MINLDCTKNEEFLNGKLHFLCSAVSDQSSHFQSSENNRKPNIFWCCQRTWNGNMGQKCVKPKSLNMTLTVLAIRIITGCIFYLATHIINHQIFTPKSFHVFIIFIKLIWSTKNYKEIERSLTVFHKHNETS